MQLEHQRADAMSIIIRLLPTSRAYTLAIDERIIPPIARIELRARTSAQDDMAYAKEVVTMAKRRNHQLPSGFADVGEVASFHSRARNLGLLRSTTIH